MHPHLSKSMSYCDDDVKKTEAHALKVIFTYGVVFQVLWGRTADSHSVEVEEVCVAVEYVWGLFLEEWGIIDLSNRIKSFLLLKRFHQQPWHPLARSSSAGVSMRFECVLYWWQFISENIKVSTVVENNKVHLLKYCPEVQFWVSFSFPEYFCLMLLYTSPCFRGTYFNFIWKLLVTFLYLSL